MLLRNYYNFLAYTTLGMTYGSTFEDGSLKVKTVDGELRTPSIGSFDACFANGVAIPNQNTPSVEHYMSMQGSYKFDIGFGTDDTPATFDDYKLSSWVSFAYSDPVSYSVTYDNSTKKYIKNYSVNIRNITSSDITVKEVGLYTGNGSYGYTTLFYREVLETPFTIAAGESVTYKHTFEFTYPTIT